MVGGGGGGGGEGGKVTSIPPPAIDNDLSLIFPFDTPHICVLRTF